MVTLEEFLSQARSPQEVAHYINGSSRFIYQEVERGNLPEPKRFSINMVRFFPEDLRQWLENLSAKPKTKRNIVGQRRYHPRKTKVKVPQEVVTK
jgi:predicted DNA-binding transcriptional regulator AlpA